jgi:hypothetical protein
MTFFFMLISRFREIEPSRQVQVQVIDVAPQGSILEASA